MLKVFRSKKQPEGEIIYGTISEFHYAKGDYPLINSIIKFIPSRIGLYIRYDLWIEWPIFYKPILVPWENILIFRANNLKKDGFDNYQIYYGEHFLGQVKIQPYISEKIIKFIEKEKISVVIK